MTDETPGDLTTAAKAADAAACAVIHPNMTTAVQTTAGGTPDRRSAHANLEEAIALAGAIDLRVLHAEAFETFVTKFVDSFSEVHRAHAACAPNLNHTGR